MGQNHDVCMCTQVEGVLFTSKIVCSVIHTKDFMSEDSVIDKIDRISFGRRELGLIAIVFEFEDSSEEVVFEPWQKVLENTYELCSTITIEILTRRAGSSSWLLSHSERLIL